MRQTTDLMTDRCTLRREQ